MRPELSKKYQPPVNYSEAPIKNRGFYKDGSRVIDFEEAEINHYRLLGEKVVGVKLVGDDDTTGQEDAVRGIPAVMVGTKGMFIEEGTGRMFRAAIVDDHATREGKFDCDKTDKITADDDEVPARKIEDIVMGIHHAAATKHHAILTAIDDMHFDADENYADLERRVRVVEGKIDVSITVLRYGYRCMD